MRKCELLLLLAGIGVTAQGSAGCFSAGGQSSATPAEQPRYSTLPRETSAPKLASQQSGTTRRLQAVSPVDTRVVWASGLGGTFVVTSDGGESWRAGVVPGADSLEFRDVEGISESTAYLLAAAVARVLATSNGGNSWQGYATPLIAGPLAGGFTIAFRDSRNGIVAGGTLDTTNTRPPNRVALSSDAGRSWELASPPPFPGAVFGLSYVPEAGSRTVVATGPGGAAWSAEEGRSWKEFAGVEGYWAVAFTEESVGWFVGTNGRILKATF